MKNILLVLFCFIAVTIRAQYIPNSTSYQWPGGKFLNALQIPTNCGAPTSANAPDAFTSAIYYDSCGGVFYKYDPKIKTWGQITGSGAGGVDTIYVRNDTLYGVKAGNEFFVTKLNIYTNGLNIPGYVTWHGSGLIFDVTAATYTINNITYISPAGQVTLNAADATNPRYDVIAVDITGHIVVITGTPSANPAVPQVNPNTQVFLTSVYLPAGATTPPAIDQNIIYDENAEGWTGAYTSGITVNFNNTNNPYHLTKSADVSNWFGSHDIIFTKNSGFDDAKDFSYLKFYISLKTGALTRATAVSIVNNIWVTLMNGSTAVSNSISLSSIGFIDTLGVYQNATIPLSAFTFSSTVFNAVRIRVSNGGPGFYLDYMQLQSGIAPPPQTGVYQDTTYNRNDSLFGVKNNKEFFISKLATTVTETDPLSVHITDSAAMLAPYLRSNIAAATYQPKGSYLTSEVDPIANAKTITINGNTQALSVNPNFTISAGSGTVSNIATTAPITGGTITTTGTIGITQANTSTNGYLTSTDWNTFNNKIGIASPVNGDMLVYNSGWQRIPIGSNGQIMGVVGGLPSWNSVTFQDTALHTIYANNLQTGTTSKLILADSVQATSSVTVQNSPALEFQANIWNSFGPSNSVAYWKIQSRPTFSGGVHPNLIFSMRYTGTGSSYNDQVTFDQGNITATSFSGSGTSTLGTIISSTIRGNSSALSLQNSQGLAGSSGATSINLGPTNTNTITAGTYQDILISPNYNQTSSTASNYDFLINRTETSVGSGTQRFATFQISGTEKWGVDNKGMMLLSRPIATSGSTPSNSLGTGAGTSPTASITGNDISGYITINTGSSPTASGDVITVTFATALTNTPTSIKLTPGNANAASELTKFYVDQSTASTSSWKIKNTSSALTASTTYIFYYNVTQ